MKKLQLLLVLLLASTLLFAQERNVSGVVTSVEDNEPLPGVNVLVKGTTQGTVTDIEGKYSLAVSGNDVVLVFSSVGFDTEEVEVGGQTEINMNMAPDLQSLQEVVVVGYGTQKKENLTGSVEAIRGSDIARQPVMNPSSALVGQAPGVTVTQSSSQPGADAGTIRIRGIGTLNNSDPLVMIDGVQGSLNGINPNDIEDISILKDAAAAAIYGSRAANGVVLVTTKRGKSGKFTVNYNAYGGWQVPTDLPQYLDGYGFMTNYNLARQNEGQDPLYSQEYIDEWLANYQSDPDHYPNVDWLAETFSEPGFQQQHNLSLSGGNEMVSMLGSISVMDQRGNIPNYGFKQYQARVNTDVNVSPKLKVNVDLNLRRSTQAQPSSSLEGLTRQAYRIPPIFAAVYSDGSWGPGWNGTNPVANAREGGLDEDQNNYVRGLIRAEYKPINGMSLALMYAPEYIDAFSKNFNRSYEIFDIDTKDRLFREPNINSLRIDNSRSFTNNLNFISSYEKSLSKHYLKGLVGYEMITFRNDNFYAFRDRFPLQDYPQLNAGSQENMQNGGSAYEWGLQSVFGRINYDYDGKYLLEANLRYDGSSRFSGDNKYGLFPSVSAGWRISEEAFMSNLELITDLKLRASWGRLGNQNIFDINNPILTNYPFASLIRFGNNYIFGGSPANGVAQFDLANANISWETSETTNFGLDLGLSRNRLTFSAEYYIRNTYDILLRLPIPQTMGLNAPYQNAGQVRNTGWDLLLGWQDNVGEFNYGINLNFSDVRNEVMDLKEAGPFINGASIIEEGEPINAIYGYRSNGYFQTQEQVDNAPRQFGTVAPGDIRYENQLTIDTNGDGVPDQADEVINSQDRVVIGNPFPRYSFGLNLTAGWKGFDLGILFQGVGKRDLYLQQDAVWAFYNAGKIQEWHLDYWTPENPDASYPRLIAGSSHNNYETSDFWVFDASYIRLRNLQFGYTFPQPMMDNTFMQRLRIYFSGQNLFTLDRMPQGWDPDTPNGATGAVYPITSVFTFGVDLTF